LKRALEKVLTTTRRLHGQTANERKAAI